MPIQTLHLRSSVQGKEPVAGTAAGQLPVGSIGINFNATEPFLTIQDSAGNIRRVAGIKVGATAPATPTAGEAWLDTTIAGKPVFKVHDGTAWQSAAAGTSSGSSQPATPVAGDLWVDTSTASAPVVKIFNGTSFVSVAPDASETVKGLVELATVVEAETGTDTTRAVTPAGLKAAVVKISGGASGTAPSSPSTGQLWTDTSGTAPAVKVWDGTKWVPVGAAPADATTAVKGIVQLADAAAVTAGTAGRVVTADQLKATNDAVATAAGGGIASITGTAPVAVTGTGNSRTIAVGDATASAKGIVQLADAAAVTAGTAGLVVDAAQLKAHTPPDATEAIRGIAEIATQGEVNAGTDDERFVTPKKLSAFVTEKLKATWLPSNSINASDEGASTWNGPADTLTATPSVEVSINGGAYGTGGPVATGQTVKVRWQAAAVTAGAHDATLTGRVVNAAGNVAVDYTLKLDKLPDAITIAPQTNVALGAAVDSAASTAITGLNAPARIWLGTTDGTNPQISIGGGAWAAVPATAAAGVAIVQGQTFRLRHTTKGNSSDVTTTTVRVGWDASSSVQASFVTTNVAVPPLAKASDPTIAGAAVVGGTLTATAGTATGGTAPITYATKWQVSADGTSGWADIAGATGLTYAIQAGDKDKYLRAVTTATDATTPTAQTLELPSVASAKVIQPPSITLGWNADTDAYTRDPVANRVITAQVGMRRCLVTDAGGVTYLDADDSTKLAGDWLRICETTELTAAYTGTHGAEVANTALRGSAPAWAAGAYTKGQRVASGGGVWECLAATTTATPAAGTAAATLTGAAGQVMVEIPRFSVWHETAAANGHLQHQFHLLRGTKLDGGYAIHPAFIRGDGSYRDYIYVGAYQGTGTNGNGSASGVNNTINMTRAACRTACARRGANWHQLGYWEYNALQWLLFTEYQDMNSQKVLGNGAIEGGTYQVAAGKSNARGNRCGHLYTSGGSANDYVSYRGVENFYGRAWQWVDGLNLNATVPYVCGDPSKWADDTATGYNALPAIPAGGGDYIRDIGAGVAFMPSSLVGGSATTFVGDALYTGTHWHVALVGGGAHDGARVGALSSDFSSASSDAGSSIGGRICYSV
jgi:hypothetical protein